MAAVHSSMPSYLPSTVTRSAHGWEPQQHAHVGVFVLCVYDAMIFLSLLAV